MKKINRQIEEIKIAVKTAQSFLTGKSFAAYQEDYPTQRKILKNTKLAQDKCYDLGMDVVKKYGWQQPDP